MIENGEIARRAETVPLKQVASRLHHPRQTHAAPALLGILAGHRGHLAAKTESLELMLNPEARAALQADQPNPAGTDTTPGDELIEKLVAKACSTPPTSKI